MKNKFKKILVSIVISIMIVSCFSFVHASELKVAKTTSKSTTKTTKGYVEPKSLFLSSINIKDYDFYPEFNKNTTTYYVSVPTTVSSLDVTATPEETDTKVTVTGNTALRKNESTVKITLSQSGASSKVYTIIVTKQVDNGLKLSSLTIENAEIAPEFVTTKYYYRVTAERNVENMGPLKITATPNSTTATVEIIGNENLQEGDNNIITILLLDNGKTTTYQLNVFIKKPDTIIVSQNNKLVEYAKKAQAKAYEFFADQNKRIATAVAGGFVLLVILFLIIKSKIKKRKIAESKENLKKRAH